MDIPIVAVVMAGGAGERFWPLSRRLHPKQLLRLSPEEKSLLEEAVERLGFMIPSERILIATHTSLQGIIRGILKEIPEENILGEPIRRNTAGCLAFAAAYAMARWGKETDDLVLVNITADHKIGNPDLYQQTFRTAAMYARDHDALVVVGLEPTRPDTGYGYIEVADRSAPVEMREAFPIFHVHRFKEKPARSLAEQYLATGRFFWNSGMFFWKASTLLSALDQHFPELSQAIRDMRDGFQESPYYEKRIAQIFEKLPSISIDRGLMEKASNTFMVPGNFAWDDLGTWDALSRIGRKDEQGNATWGSPILIDCRNSTVVNHLGAENIAVGVIGMENVVVVATADGILVCPQDRVQDVRLVVEKLKAANAKQL